MNNKISQTTVECPKCGKHTFQDRLNPDSDMPFYSNIVGKCNNQESHGRICPGISFTGLGSQPAFCQAADRGGVSLRQQYDGT